MDMKGGYGAKGRDEVGCLKLLLRVLRAASEPLHRRTRIVLESSFVDQAEAALAQQVGRAEVVSRRLQRSIRQATW